MEQSKKAFTLVELIIVVVIVGILAMVAIPRYFVNIAKAQKSQIYVGLNTIREAMQAYFAVNGAYLPPNTFPIIVTVDGEAIMNVADPSNTGWAYHHESTSNPPVYAYKQPGSSCWYGIDFSGKPTGTCIP